MTEKYLINKAKNLILRGDNDGVFDTCGLIFPIATENIKGTYANFDLEGKDVLTVTSSGDHILSAILNGAKKVDSFDINYFTEYYYQFKKAIIKTFDNFKDFERIIFYRLLAEGSVSSEDYEKIRENLDGKYLEFWDQVIDYVLTNGMRLNRIFFSFNSLQIYKLIDYLNQPKYNLLKEKLENAETNFIHTDLFKLDKNLNSKYDYMFLSNIADYAGVLDVKKYANDKLLPYIKDNGEIIYAYLYDADERVLKKYDDNYFEIPSTSNRDLAKDYVLTLKK